MPFLTREIVVSADSPFAGSRIDGCVRQLAAASKSFAAGLFDHDCVRLNDLAETDPGRVLGEGDKVAIRYEEGRRYSPTRKPQKKHRGFSIVYEDRELIVVDKSHELLTVPTDAREPHTLVYRVNEYLKHEGRGRGAFVVHRLDRGVSGLLVFGKTRESAELLQRQFADRKPERQYLTLVVGKVANDSGTFQSHLATGAKSLKRYSTDDPEDGELAVTHYQIVRRLPSSTLLTVQLETGRRNQIRVHFAEVGHPVYGDTRYRPDLALTPSWPWKRLSLHAATLAFDNPETQEHLRFHSEMPEEMSRFIRDAERGITRDHIDTRERRKMREKDQRRGF